jgi:glutamine cyclotransferase
MLCSCTKDKSHTATPVYDIHVIHTYPHRSDAFTQGLIFHNGYLYEGTGMYGHSSLCKVALDTGKVLEKITLPEHLWGEGITQFDNTIIQLTWKAGIVYVYHKDSLAFMRKLKINTQGWGITHNGTHLILSNGTDTLYFRDPNTFAVINTLKVTDQGKPIGHLNELEYIKGRIYANVWQTTRIAVIDPGTGIVETWIDLSPLKAKHPRADVLNGIAYDADNDRLFVTGKNWSALYEIEVVRQDR